MLTLLVTVLATAYFVVPELLTRFVVSFYFVRKASTGTRSEEILRAAFWASAPLAVAWWTRGIGPWSFHEPIANDAKAVFSALYSDKVFDQDSAAFYQSFGHFVKFNACLLSRTYFIVIAIAIIFGWIALRLGSVRSKLKPQSTISALLHWAFVPRVSEWHVALSPMLVRARKELTVRVDVMTKGGILYRGHVFEKRIKADGDLATLILENAQRMVRADFMRDREHYEAKKEQIPGMKKPDTEDYWKKIPGEMFLLNGSEISTVNIRHVRPVGVISPQKDQDLIRAFGQLREQISVIEKQIGKPGVTSKL